MSYCIKYLSLILVLISASCTQSPESADLQRAAEATATPAPQQETLEPLTRKLIKEGHVEFETFNLEVTRRNMLESVAKHGGYVSSDQEYNSPGRTSNTVVIRVPADDFNNLLREATRGVDHFERKEINVLDITEEFLDVQARLKTKKELEQRFIDLLQAAKNVTELLEIEKQIGQLRSEIESIEGRLNYLSDQVSLSTLTLTFYQRVPNETAFGQRFQDGFRNGWNNLIWFFIGLSNIWPFILMGGALLMAFRLARSKGN